ncbi:MAG: hypothetical protein NTY45_02410, partial [Elusimicrobia bacterium]|nr:hypothetical protein [Elusimicrobiota bacterium]
MTTAEKISYALMTLILLAVIVFHMGHVVLAALFSFMFMEFFFRAARTRVPCTAARWLAAVGFIITAGVVIFIFLRFIKQTLLTLPDIVEVALPKVMTLAQNYGLELPFTNFQDLREFA